MKHLTKDRPKFHGRNSLKDGNKPQIHKQDAHHANAHEDTTKENNWEHTEKEGVNRNTKLTRVKSLPPPTLPKPKVAAENNQSKTPNVSRKTPASFKLPGLGEITKGSLLSKYKKDTNDENKDTVKLLYKKDYGENRSNFTRVKQENNNNTNIKTSHTDVHDGRPFYTNRLEKHTKSFREKLGQRGDSFRRSFNKISKGVVTKSQDRKAKLNEVHDKQSLLYDDDPDEKINQILDQNEQKDNPSLIEEKPKKKRAGLSSQSVRITKVDKSPVSPTYRQLDVSPGTVRRNSHVTTETVKKEEPTETYKRISEDDRFHNNTRPSPVRNRNGISMEKTLWLNTPSKDVSYQQNATNNNNNFLMESDTQTQGQSEIRRCHSTPLRRKAQSPIKSFERSFSTKNKFLPFSGRGKQKSTEELPNSPNDDQKAFLYEEKFKRSNSRKTSQESWLGRSGLLDLGKNDENDTLKNLNTSKENLLDLEDTDDEDNMLNRRIEIRKQHSLDTPPVVPQRKDSKRRMMGVGGLSFRKKYNIDKQ